jgi:alkylation response protein AidB-like acyl-CoA dehydrogenase
MESAKALLYKAADMIDRKDPEAALYTSMAKAEATDASVYCADENLQLHGGIGCLKGCEAERIFRDAHAARIYDGTTNVLDMVISRDMLK